MPITVKRIYDAPEKSDGYRILVDRLWPRGISKDSAHIDEWLKELAPSDALRKWFHHDSERWQEFQKRYKAELDSSALQETLRRLGAMAKKKKVTLLFGAKDIERNNAAALASFIKKML
ncbi:MAG: DUF488 domain-containing protein [Bacteroidota bacterium]|nr:DUF488 domain-containing protein [Bacteroidota bacterium]